MSLTDMSTPQVIVDLRELVTSLREQLVRTQKELALARVDPTTGLPTRQHWTGLATVHRRAESMVLLADLDGFKAINDRSGHAAGDAVLTAIAHRLKAGLPPGSFVGRLGGDEFVALTPRALNLEELNRLVISAISPIKSNDHEFRVGISIGASALAAMPGASLSTALAAADHAMYQAKRAGGGCRVYDVAEQGLPNPAQRPTRRGRHEDPPERVDEGDAP